MNSRLENLNSIKSYVVTFTVHTGGGVDLGMRPVDLGMRLVDLGMRLVNLGMRPVDLVGLGVRPVSVC